MSSVFIGCEESGVVRDSMLDAGILAISCDLQPSRSNRGPHWQQDIIEVLNSVPNKFFRLIILHPDCTYVAVSGNRWYGKGTPGYQKRLDAIEWILELWSLAKQKAFSVALENPVSVIFPELKKVGAEIQYIQPWQFGHGETKKTGLALHNLKRLIPENIVDGREQRIWKMPPGENRKRDRSETFKGIADAFTKQWGLGVVPLGFDFYADEMGL
jgi:hypothetical protein